MPQPRSVCVALATVPALVLVSMVFSTSVRAQFPQPKLASVSRPGVRSGESAEVTLRGTNLEGVNQLWFDHPGLKAARVKDVEVMAAAKRHGLVDVKVCAIDDTWSGLKFMIPTELRTKNKHPT